MSKKPIILLCWGYHRIGWNEPFLKLKNQFQFHYLFFTNKEEDEVSNFDLPVHYWNDFNNAQEILELIKPEKIIFMSIDSGLTIALNITARSNNFKTYIMQHGLYRNYEFYLKLQNQGKADISKAINEIRGRNNTLRFILKSIRIKTLIPFLRLFYFLFITRKKGFIIALHEAIFKMMKPNKYLGFTMYNMRIHFEREKISKNEVEIIGNPYFDDILQFNPEKNVTAERYYLLIDQPLAENSFGFMFNTGISKVQVNEFYSKLNEFALKNNAKLYIKLHPGSYKSTFMLQHENIIYFKDADNVQLIHNSLGCFGCSSTLMIPVLYIKPTVLFTYNNIDDVENMAQFGLAKVLDLVTFEVSDIEFIDKSNDPVKRQEFIDKFLYNPEINATDNLKKVLLS